ncbi:377_t:CDS:2, partial [Cetraspora pellucida]
SDSDQDDANEMTDYAQDSDNYTPNKDYNFEIYDSDTLTPVVNTLPLSKKGRKNIRSPMQDQNINPNTLTPATSPLKKNLRSSVQKYNGIKTTSEQDNAIKNNAQDSGTSNNTDEITENH